MPIKLKKSKACTQNSNVMSNSPPLSFSSSLSLSLREKFMNKVKDFQSKT